MDPVVWPASCSVLTPPVVSKMAEAATVTGLGLAGRFIVVWKVPTRWNVWVTEFLDRTRVIGVGP